MMLGNTSRFSFSFSESDILFLIKMDLKKIFSEASEREHEDCITCSEESESDHENCSTCLEEETMREDETPTTSDEEFIVSDVEMEEEDEFEELI